jgi:hypothetical protein
MERMNTIGALIRHNHRLGAYRNKVDCHHYRELDLPALGERLGMGHSTMKPDLAPRLKCSACGGRDIALILFGDSLGP